MTAVFEALASSASVTVLDEVHEALALSGLFAPV